MMLETVTLALALADVRLALEEAVFATEVTADRARSVADALASLATAEGNALPLISLPGLRPDAQLSSREQEVLALLAEGRTNKAIAEALYVSPNTVKRHVTALKHKLRAASRVQLATIATRHELHHHAATSITRDPCSAVSLPPHR